MTVEVENGDAAFGKILRNAKAFQDSNVDKNPDMRQKRKSSGAPGGKGRQPGRDDITRTYQRQEPSALPLPAVPAGPCLSFYSTSELGF